MKKYIYLFVIIFGTYACGNSSSDENSSNENSTIDADDAKSAERAAKAKKVFFTVPSPYETALIFERSGVGYNIGVLNPIDNVNNYSTNVKQALNFGVYGADLSYANIFDQSQQCMFYMNCAKKLADGLGVTSAFDAETMERIETNMNNRDSLMNIINDSYWIADSYLKENGQDYLSALIISGGWVEGLYLGSATLDKDNPNAELMESIANQKYSLDNLIGLIELYDHPEVDKMKIKLQNLKTSFDKITTETTETTVSTNNEMATIGGGSTLTYTKENILEIAATVKTIRDGIIE
ncbi:MAG: hypothetical protein H6587_04820 [Flavobacteriales bacterium]|nr:hypothetical protein [Flavobacteriales bacterium]